MLSKLLLARLMPPCYSLPQCQSHLCVQNLPPLNPFNFLIFSMSLSVAIPPRRDHSAQVNEEENPGMW
jgi:hypothetical protein